MNKLEELKKWVKEELTVTEINNLGKNKEKVKQLLGITADGRIVFKIDLSKLLAKEVISLYMIGKVYAQIAGYVETETVTNKELIEALRFPEGTIGYTLKELRDDKIIIAEKTGVHRISNDKIGVVLDSIFKKIQNRP